MARPHHHPHTTALLVALILATMALGATASAQAPGDAPSTDAAPTATGDHATAPVKAAAPTEAAPPTVVAAPGQALEPSAAGASAKEPEPAPSAEPAQAPTEAAEPTSAADDEGIEEIEEVIEVVDVTPVAAAEAPPRGGTLELIGKLHPPAVHMPIGWIVLLLVFDLVFLVILKGRHGQAGLFILGMVVVGIIPAIVTGLLRASTREFPPDLIPVMETHRTMAIAAGSITLAAFVLRLALRKRLEGLKKAIYFVMVLAAAGLFLVVGHLGGKLVFGPGFLPF